MTNPTARGDAWKTHAALWIVQLAFASQTVEGKLAMGPRATGGEGVDPWALAMLRMGGAAVCFSIAARALGLLKPTTWRDRLTLAGLSLLGITVNQTLFLVGLRTTRPVSAALLSVTIPIFTAALAVVMRVERPSARLAVGLGLAAGGVLSLTGVTALDRGALLVTVNSLSYSLYLVLSRDVVRRLGAFTVVTWIFAWGALVFAPFGVPVVLREAPSWTPRAWLLIAYVLAMPTIVAYACNAWALGRSSPTLVTIYIFLQPPISALLSWIQLGVGVSARLGLAALLIFAGVALVSTRKPSVTSAAARSSPRG